MPFALDEVSIRAGFTYQLSVSDCLPHLYCTCLHARFGSYGKHAGLETVWPKAGVLHGASDLDKTLQTHDNVLAACSISYYFMANMVWL